MLLSFWSPKGGVGTSVLTAACGLVLAKHTDVRLADFGGDQPAVLGLAADPAPGLAEWLLTGPQAPADALDRLAVDAGNGLTLLPRGDRTVLDASPEAGAALGVVLANDPRLTIADVASPDAAAMRALIEVSDVSIVVVRDCYLALRRAVHTPLASHAAGVVVLEEPGRSLSANEVTDVLRLPLLGSVPFHLDVARVVDSGVLASRMPNGFKRSVRRVFERLGLPGREGRAA
jgi:hypothetical protein